MIPYIWLSKWMSAKSCFVIVFLLILTACTRHRGYEESLSLADSLMNSSPDSALAILDSIEPYAKDLSRNQLRDWQLLRLMAQDQCDTIFCSDSLQLILADYFDHHGTPNERMTAHYLLGRAYSDMSEAPQALRCFLDAVACADTTSIDCDFKTLFRIYGQIAMAYRSQGMSDDELASWSQYSRFALKSGDRYNCIFGEEMTIGSYYGMGDTVSCLRVTERCRKEYLAHGMPKNAASVLPYAIDIHLQNSNYDKAREMMEIFEGKSGLFDSLGNISKGRESYYYSKGLYYLGTHKNDSAEWFFRKLQNAHFNHDYQVNKGLLALYLNKNNIDSISKYAKLYEKSVDDIFNDNLADAVSQAATYNNYDRFHKESKETSDRAERLKILLLIGLLLALCGFFLFRNRRSRILNRKEPTIAQLQSKNVQMNEGQGLLIDRLDEFVESDIVIRLKQKAENKEFASRGELGELRAAAIKHLPVFMQTLSQTGYELQSHETILCILIKAKFRPSEIAVLMNLTPQNITNLRARLNKKMFHADKGAKDFNDKIINLTSL